MATTRPPTRARRNAHLTADERDARGRAAREAVPRQSHGVWAPAANRPDPVTLLEDQAEHRVHALVPIRHGRMLASPFAFYRGAALIMASDLSSTPHSGINVQLCGDAHLANFGVFGTPERRLVFDINDFDETLPGPWEWDVKRLAASLEALGRDRGFSDSDRREIVVACVREYRQTIRSTAEMKTLDAWYDHMDADEVTALMQQEVSEKRLSKREEKVAERGLAKARTRDHAHVFAKRVGEVDGELRIVADPPLIVPLDDVAPAGTERDKLVGYMRVLMRTYRRSLAYQHHPLEEFEYVDTAHKVVGVGSVGLQAWIHLLVGRDDDDPLFLQSKEAQASVLERFVGRSEFRNHGRRVVVGQRLMQAASDIFLGWVRVVGIDGELRDYYVRQFHDWKGNVEVESMLVPGTTLYGRLCGATLARAHGRWGDRIAIASYLGKGGAFDEAIADFASAYADQNERDYEAFAAAVKTGRLDAEEGL
ncbi:MAG TPA: DUF2252 domain-containing protein [Gaiellaceae bacterium]|nr:DUF2252 domain-containing protein [Gaiellaceae bacterium]